MTEERACPTPCDTDCDAPCHEVHAIVARRSHEPSSCAARLASCCEAGERTSSEDWQERAETAEQFNLKLIEQAKEQAATIERAVELRDKWLKWPTDDPHYGAGLMLARYLDLPMEET